MVYCGKPSKGCNNCRAKRTKCDLTRPACGQCKRAGRQCGGYRDQANLMFRDQSNDTASKFHIVDAKGRDPSLAPASFQVDGVGDPSTDSSTSSRELALTQPLGNVFSNSLSVSPEDQAACFFFSNYVFNKFDSTRGYMDYLPDIYSRNSPESPLGSIVTSLGMAGLANVRNAPEAKAVSTYKYASALHGVNAKLRDPAKATDDETLITVLLLGLYETNNGVVAQSLKAWVEHVNGAMALISLRGEEQLKSSVGRRLFYQLRSQILIGCLHRRVPVPENVIAWSKAAHSYHDQNSEPIPENQLADILFRFNNWRANDMETFEDYREPMKNVETALNFDAELMEWLISFQLQYAFTTMPVKEKSEDVFSDYYHIYPDIFTAVIWQHFRSVRILINEIVVTQIAALYLKSANPSTATQLTVNTATCKDIGVPPNFPFANNFYASHALLTSLAHDICASVPYYLNFHLHGSRWDKVQPPPPAANGNLLLWPLFMVGQLQAASPMMRTWAAERLLKVSEVMGVKQAGMIGAFLARGEELTILDKPVGIR